MGTLKEDIEELKRLINHSDDFDFIYNQIKSNIDIYNVCNSMLSHYKDALIEIVDGFNSKNENKIILENINQDNMYLLHKNNIITYDSNTDQHMININGNIIKGNIGNLYSIKDPNAKNINVCNITNCKNNKCYHSNENRNYYNTHWMYGNKKYNRKIGGKNTIEMDLNSMNIKDKKNELKLRESQLMHDILIYDKLYNSIND